MIYVKLIGRLGNQMFYYALARRIQLEMPSFGEIILIPEDKEYDKWGGIRLFDFKINAKEFDGHIKISAWQKVLDASFKCYRLLSSKIRRDNYEKTTIKFQNTLNRNGLYCMTGDSCVDICYNAKMKNIYISGVWENPYYFECISDILRTEFVPVRSLCEHNIDLYNQIQSSESVCISIRKGDFLKKGNEKFNVCTDDYYYQAMKIMKDKIENCRFFVFSDDIEWCKNNLVFPYSVEFENNGGNDPVWEKIRIMSRCKHFIISNSTFSWWAQFLSDNKDKIVVAPYPWRKGEKCVSLYGDDFIVLDGEGNNIESGIWRI